ncbi:MAG: AbgT family transporter [Ignavibacteria bacterium]|nr:AbgT family transporter [Ignavibacteria bacterium]
MKRKAKGFFNNFINFIEKVGNALPHPALLFCFMAILVVIISFVGSTFRWEAQNPANGEFVYVVNLLSVEGIHRIMLEMVNNYTSFAPLGIVIVAMLGISVVESSGLLKAVLNVILVKSPKRIITFVVVFVGVLSNAASDLGYVLIIPLAGVIFQTLGRHPIAGIAAAFAGVSGGFSANILIGTIDPLLAGISTESARIIDPNYYVLPTANYYFMAISTFLIAILGTFVTNSFVEPRLGKFESESESSPITNLQPKERKGLVAAFLVFILWVFIFLLGLIPENGFLRGPNNSLLASPLLKGFVAVLFIVSVSCGVVYGYIAGTFKKHTDVINGIVASFKGIVPFLVLVFFASQFVALFKWSNLGLIIAVGGASLLKSLDLGLIPLVVAFVIFSAFLNLFMGSASAKWAIIGPIFVPLFMLLGYSPELSQAVFRIGDSVTNVISPMMSFFALIISYFQKYDEKAGIGIIIGTMLPYSIVFFLGWTFLLIIWVALGLPLGPGSELYYVQPK